MPTIEDIAADYANKPYYRDGKVLSVAPRLYLKRGFIAGFHHRDEEVAGMKKDMDLAMQREKELIGSLQSIADGAIPVNEDQMISWIQTARSIAFNALKP